MAAGILAAMAIATPFYERTDEQKAILEMVRQFVDDALVAALRATAPSLEIEEVDCHINDPAFAQAAVRRLVAMVARPAAAKR